MKSWIRFVCLWAVVVLGGMVWAAPSAALLSSTPYMGWNTYYGLGRAFNEQAIISVAQSLIDTGLAQAGYRIVWLDAGWSSGARNSSGQLTVDSSQWPDGMAWLTAWLHAHGLLAGIYTDAGATGCGGQGVGSLGHYQQDADTFAAWGFDAVKVDFCGAGQEGLNPQTQYTQFAAALANNSSQRPMILNVDNFWEPGQINGVDPSYANSAYANYEWAPQIAQSWRTDTDVGLGGGMGIQFADVLRNLDADAAHPEVAGPGHWNDPDYLGPELGMTSAEAQAQMSMWAILAAPLILGSDPRVLSQQSITMLENPQVIAIDQDSLGAQGTLVQQAGDEQVWVKPLSNGDRAVALLNRGGNTAQIGTSASAIGMPPSRYYGVDNVWQDATAPSTGGIGASVPPYSAFLYRVSVLQTLSVDSTGTGSGRVVGPGISCPGTCAAVFNQGTPVTLTATPAAGSAFTGWTGSGCWGKGSCVMTMSSDRGVAATFATPAGTAGPTSSTGSGVRNRLGCRGPAGLRCRFSETLATVETSRGGKPLAVSAATHGRNLKTKAVVVGSKTMTLSTARSVMGTVKLNATGRELLKRFGQLPITVTIAVSRDGRQVAISPRQLTIKPTGTAGKTSSRSLLKGLRLAWAIL